MSRSRNAGDGPPALHHVEPHEDGAAGPEASHVPSRHPLAHSGQTPPSHSGSHRGSHASGQALQGPGEHVAGEFGPPVFLLQQHAPPREEAPQPWSEDPVIPKGLSGETHAAPDETDEGPQECGTAGRGQEHRAEVAQERGEELRCSGKRRGGGQGVQQRRVFGQGVQGEVQGEVETWGKEGVGFGEWDGERTGG